MFTQSFSSSFLSKLISGERSNMWLYLKDHSINGQIVFPAVGYIEMVLCASSQLGLSLKNVAVQFILLVVYVSPFIVWLLTYIKYKEVLVLPAEGKVLLRTVMHGASSFYVWAIAVTFNLKLIFIQIYSKDVTNDKSIVRSMSDAVPLDSFTLHACGELVSHNQVTTIIGPSFTQSHIKYAYEKEKVSYFQI
jgi:hypothetical protein